MYHILSMAEGVGWMHTNNDLQAKLFNHYTTRDNHAQQSESSFKRYQQMQTQNLLERVRVVFW